MRTVPERKRRTQTKEPVFRVPRELSDVIYVSFNSLAHRSRLADGCAVFACRMIREESFSRDELRSIKSIIEAPESGVSAQILGADTMLGWIEDCLANRVTPQ